MAGFISVADRVGLRPRLGFTDLVGRFGRNTLLPLVGIGAMLFSPSGCGHRTEKPIDTTQTNLWLSSGPWANDDPLFNCGWDPSNAVNNNGRITLTLNDTPGSGRPFSSGEYRTRDFFKYVTVEAGIRAANGSGLITSLFTVYGSRDHTLERT